MKMKSIVCVLGIVLSLTSLAQNIGINTPTPNAALDVRSTGSTSATYGVLVSNNTNDTSLVVSDNGNVGIGTTLPAYTLDVQSSNPIAARFSGRVTGQNAVNANEFITLQQAGTLGGSGSQANGTQFSVTSGSTFTMYGALIYCRTLSEGGFSDWRLPRVQEFIDMIQDDAITLPNFTQTNYWLNADINSVARGNTGGANGIVFTNLSGGYFSDVHTFNSYHVICVR